MVSNNSSSSGMNTNMTLGPDDIISDSMEIPHDIAIAGLIIGIIIIVIGCFGNILIIFAVVLNKPLCKSSNIFVVSLATCDLFQTLMVKPLYVHTYIAGEWVFGKQICLYALFASNLAILESILHVSVIAFYRYIFICHPKRSQCFHSLKVVLINLIMIYLLPVLLVIIPSLQRIQNTDVIFNKKIMFCSFVRHSNFRLGGVLKKVVFLSVAAAFLFYCYVRIIYKVRESRISINEQGSYSPSRIRREMTLLKMVIFTFLAFVISYLPLSILYGVDTNRTFPFISYFIGVVFLWLSSSINWIIYGCVNRQYCLAYNYLLCRIGHLRRQSCQNGSTSRSSHHSNGNIMSLHETNSILSPPKSRHKSYTHSSKKFVTIVDKPRHSSAS